ncbi:MAG: glycosyltransferase family 2 protein [Synechococcaceae cyanobacterium ELA445]
MGWVPWLPALALLALLLPQSLLTALYARHLRLGPYAGAPQAGAFALEGPTAEVVLCLRGVDPGLEVLLRQLARQRFSPWRLRLVVDSREDPAWALAQRVVAACELEGIATWRSVRIEWLSARPEKGSLKCAALRQAFLSLDLATQLVVLVDGDAAIDARWLASLATACWQEGVGAVSGNRWFAPAGDSLSGVVRALWGTGAIVLMSAFGIPWGGSLAIRRQAMEESGWLEVLRTSLCEDTALAAPLARAGWRHLFLPAAIAVETDEGPRLGALVRWIGRQLLMARLHHPAWPLVALHGFATSALLTLVFLQLLAAGLMGRQDQFVLLLAALACYELGSWALAAWIARITGRALAGRGKGLAPLTPQRLLGRLLLLPLTQLVYGWAMVRAALARRVEWRDITYQLEGEGVRIIGNT